jgi:hypothetical protein
MGVKVAQPPMPKTRTEITAETLRRCTPMDRSASKDRPADSGEDGFTGGLIAGVGVAEVMRVP